jgi:hypothetical protein
MEKSDIVSDFVNIFKVVQNSEGCIREPVCLVILFTCSNLLTFPPVAETENSATFRMSVISRLTKGKRRSLGMHSLLWMLVAISSVSVAGDWRESQD